MMYKLVVHTLPSLGIPVVVWIRSVKRPLLVLWQLGEDS